MLIELAEESLIPLFAQKSAAVGLAKMAFTPRCASSKLPSNADDGRPGGIMARHLQLLDRAYALGREKYHHSNSVRRPAWPGQALERGLARVARGRDQDDDLLVDPEILFRQTHERSHQRQCEVLESESWPMEKLEERHALPKDHWRGPARGKAFDLGRERRLEALRRERREEWPQYQIGKFPIA